MISSNVQESSHGWGRIVCLVLLLFSLLVAGHSAEVVVDFGKGTGEIRALHGVNGGPVNYGGVVDLSEQWRDAGIPLTRLHDCNWPAGDVVDIHTIFPNPNADPADPASYDFAATDVYIRQVLATGARIVFRLGESIEHKEPRRFVHPPTDPERWAAVCLGIIRHYNEGWGNGSRHGIEYWEIWNEPENRPAMWTGRDEQFLRLYEVTSKAIKREFPQLKVGGPGFGHVGKFEGEIFTPTPFVRAFLERCRESGAPLDFFSWHRYTDDPASFVRYARAIERLLKDAGFSETESHLNEWNYLPRNDWAPIMGNDPIAREQFFAEIGGPAGAAFVVTSLIQFQDAAHKANYYSGVNHGFGLFTFYGRPQKSFHAFRAFRAMTETPNRVDIRSQSKEVAVIAGLAKEQRLARVLLANFNSEIQEVTVSIENLPWSNGTNYRVSILDGANDLAPSAAGELAAGEAKITLPLRRATVSLVELRPTQ